MIAEPLGTAEEFMAQVMDWVRGSYAVLAADVGIRSGAFDVLRQVERGTSAEIAEAGGLSERHVREWLSLMATTGMVRYDAESGVFSAAPGLLAARLPPGPPPVVALASFAPAVAETMKHGGGLGYDFYGDQFVDMLERGSHMSTDLFLLDAWLPSVDGLTARLADGASVLEIGCGTGHAANVLARGFPASTVVGYDLNAEALRRGSAEAESWGLDNVRFEQRDVAALPADCDADFDVVLAFDCVHDQAHPRQVLTEVRRVLRLGGVFVMLEPRTSSNLEDNLADPFATAHYMMSLFHCMQVSIAGGGEGLGTAWGEQRARALLEDVGFEVRSAHEAPGMTIPQTLFVAVLRP